MKYVLPENLKCYQFYCDEQRALVTYGSCKRRCKTIDCRECWERHLRTDLVLDCAVDNERKAERFVNCSKCGSNDIIGLAFDRFLCNDCGHVEFCNSDDYKTIMGDEYISIDEQELVEMLNKVK